jgi:hypothetical protein
MIENPSLDRLRRSGNAVAQLAQQDESGTLRRRFAFPSGDGGTVGAAMVGQLLLGPAKGIAKGPNIDQVCAHASMCEKDTPACQAETHTESVKK